MKKFFIVMIALMMSFMVNAQTAIETPQLMDNWYVGVGGQVTTPMDFNKAFPINSGASLVIGKQLTPVFGVNVEDNVWFGSHSNGSHRFGVPHFESNNDHNAIRANYLGMNGTINLSNLLCGYRGTPRKFEVQTVTGIGWFHMFTPNASDKSRNDLGAKTGLNFLFNLGKTKAHGLYVQPAVLWNLTKPGCDHTHVAFNKNGAQVGIQVGYVYRFSTSNGTHHFKTYDVGAMLNEIDRLNAELANKPTHVADTVIQKVEIIKYVNQPAVTSTNETVYFAYDSAELDARAKEALNQLGQNGVYCVDAYASNEGSTEYNKALSQRRADAVKAYLEGRGCKVDTSVGHGVVFGPTTGRVAVVTSK